MKKLKINIYANYQELLLTRLEWGYVVIEII